MHHSVKVIALLLAAVCSVIAVEPTWMNVHDSPRSRAEALLAKMELKEKLHMVHGDIIKLVGSYVGDVPAIPRLNISALKLEDGPQGVADRVDGKTVTAWPSALTVVTAWDRDLMYQFAAGCANEQRGKGTNIMLGPMVNIARVPFGGRNFESFGEDPYLAAALAAESVRGIQSQQIMGCVKHFLDNNQEHDRTKVSANVDERTQFEVYYPAFKAAIDAGVATAMCSYNRVNSTYACENNKALNEDLKGFMNFTGFVMSDWLATHSTAAAANAGLDMEMPGNEYFGPLLEVAIIDGKVSMSRIDDMVLRILTQMFRFGLFDHGSTGNLKANVTTAEHHQLARKLAAAGTVLLKNDNNLLPLTVSKYPRIAIIGDDAEVNPTYAGGGSGHVEAGYIVTPLAGITARAGASAKVTYAPSSSVSTAQDVAKGADIAIVFVGVSSSEGSDRSTLSLGAAQDALVSAIRSVQPKTVVVTHCPGAVLMPWRDQIPAIIAAFLPGNEDGNAIADILFGDVNPSARLAVTFPKTDSENPFNSTLQYPGVNEQTYYTERLLVGYKWWDATNTTPLFCFGHGLSYTTFSYTTIVATSTSVSVVVKNTGSVLGAEVVQLYISYPASAGEPPKLLRGFQKIQLEAGESESVSFPLRTLDLSIWDVVQHNFVEVHGTFTALVGSSSCNIKLTGTFTN